MWFLPPDESGRLQQIDLSDDMIVGELFSSGAWFDVKEALYTAQVRVGRHRGVEGGVWRHRSLLLLVAALAAHEAARAPCLPSATSQGSKGSSQPLRMSEEEFRDVVSLLDGAEELQQ